jgi:hypothetical protein
MPRPSKGTEIVKLLLSKVSKSHIKNLLFRCFSPIFGANMSDMDFQYSNNRSKDLYHMTANFINNLPLFGNNLALLRNKVGLLWTRNQLIIAKKEMQLLSQVAASTIS